MNRAVSLRSSKGRHDTSPAQSASKSHRFTFGSFRGNMQPNLSKRLYKLIKTEKVVISVLHVSPIYVDYRRMNLRRRNNKMWLNNFRSGEKRLAMKLSLIFLINSAFS